MRSLPAPSLTSLPRCQDPLAEAGGDLIEKESSFTESTQTNSNPTANRVPRGKEKLMTTINEYLQHRTWHIASGLRTGVAVVAAGVSTGASFYLLTLLVGSWA